MELKKIHENETKELRFAFGKKEQAKINSRLGKKLRDAIIIKRVLKRKEDMKRNQRYQKYQEFIALEES